MMQESCVRNCYGVGVGSGHCASFVTASAAFFIFSNMQGGQGRVKFERLSRFFNTNQSCLVPYFLFDLQSASKAVIKWLLYTNNCTLESFSHPTMHLFVQSRLDQLNQHPNYDSSVLPHPYPDPPQAAWPRDPDTAQPLSYSRPHEHSLQR